MEGETETSSLLMGHKTHIHKRDMYTGVHISCVGNRKKLETTQISRTIDK